CGTRCQTVPFGLGACFQGKCGTVCAQGHADCDGNLANGCEIDLTGDPANCGGCATKCGAPANAAAACDAGRCSFRCAQHFFDCDGDGRNGCELDARSDPANCGHCGNVCPPTPNSTLACVNNRCAPTCNNG